MWMWILLGVGAFLGVVAVYDLVQSRHAILRNFPVIGHLRYVLEAIGPELRQYIVTNNDEERPFSRDERRWVYASAKQENNYFGFGTDNDMEKSPAYVVIQHSQFPLTTPHKGEADYDPLYEIPCAKVLGAHRQRSKAFRPTSIINTSAMSYGSLSGPAVAAINRGAKLAGCLQNTGEGGISRHHQHGGELIWQLGTGYFGCRDTRGAFDKAKFLDAVAANPVRAIEIKLSQGAKPGMGGLLPAAKITKEISAIRGIPMGVDCASPAGHSAFRDADSLLDFVEELATASGLPVGIKSAVGGMGFWRELAHLMATTGRGIDFVTIDGGEGGTGAAPLVFSDHVSLPFKQAFSRVYREFALQGLHDKIVFAGAGKLGFPQAALLAMALGVDLVNVGRESMLAIGCIQAQRCHTGHCPTGVATQNRWLQRGLDPTDKAARLANYVASLRKELLHLSHACGVEHPALVTLERIEILNDRYGAESGASTFGYQGGWGIPAERDREAIRALMGRGRNPPVA